MRSKVEIIRNGFVIATESHGMKEEQQLKLMNKYVE